MKAHDWTTRRSAEALRAGAASSAAPSYARPFALGVLAGMVGLGGGLLGCEDTPLTQLPTPDVQVDELDQRAAALVDILWVVDNSGTMVQEQEALANNFDAFITGLTLCQGTGVANDICDFATKTCRTSGETCTPPDYHIGVVSTDTRADQTPGVLENAGRCVPAVGMPVAEDRHRYCRTDQDCVHDPSDPDSSSDNATCDPGQGVRFVTPETPGARSAFSTLVTVGTAGGAREQGIRAAAMALGGDADPTTGVEPGTFVPAPAENAGFLRDEASLFIIFVSDEEDESFGEVPYFYRVFETVKGAGNDGVVSVSAIVGDPDLDGDGPETGGCVPEPEAFNEPGTRYIALGMYSRGLADEFRVCDDMRLTCPDGAACQRPVDNLPGICVPTASCGGDGDCSNFQCAQEGNSNAGCIACVESQCQAQSTVFGDFLAQAGVFQSICANDYGRVLDALGFEAAGLARKFTLTEAADCRETVLCCDDSVASDACETETALCVKVDGVVIPNDRTAGWVYESGSNAVFFDGDFVPPTDATVTLSYRRSLTNITTACASQLR